MTMIMEWVRDVSIYAVPLLLAVISHEVAHGWVAEKLGDPTARMLGRISLNPLVHIDLLGTVIIPLVLLVTNAPFMFGWAKPVPVQFHRLRGGRRGMAWVALAGPLTNLMLAAASALVYRLILMLFASGYAVGTAAMVLRPLFLMAQFSVIFNLVLMVINLFPVPPLDGGRVLAGVLPRRLAWQLARLERYGMLIVVILLATGWWGHLLNPVVSLFARLFL
ncbi:Zn-dependent protease (includes SpoIVFB) [Desulfacinum hydrothermale DSM 13146]|uniref:Zn-dependent protease (Includes SpoIVFB) n=1 Tax=Desulfacinum hydrothermale DSM 13146 TaxID=1121390 RepID=A0A1W1XGP3_9BACT|nr:site-2 protease family protein [Desulfacinum hydrothermale]SMC23153.1 Zn-dependent protease (includes SpoIVFB) [Desulfacinum hydrothermale DSM 13146]